MSIFSSVPVKKPKRSNFDLSHDVKLTTEFGRLTPFMCMEVMPGDTFKVNSQLFARMAPMLAPIMSRVDIYTHYFFVPNRLIWANWEEFITGGPNGTSFPVPPNVKISDLEAFEKTNNSNLTKSSSLGDYLGLPFGNSDRPNNQLQVSALPFLAYQRIYDDWYRDQNLEEESVQWPITNNGNSLGNFFLNQTLGVLRTRSWQKDYFTSALPWAQRGAEVVLPMEVNEAEVENTPGRKQLISEINGDPLSGPSIFNLQATYDSTLGKHVLSTAEGPVILNSSNDSLFVSPSVNGPTINEFRRTLAVQKWLEASARGGSRLIEQIYSHFGVRSSDARLQRTELLGGGKSPIMISEVLQNSETTSNSPLGDMAGHGVSAQANHGFKRFFEEHGFVIGIMSIMPKTGYQQGLSRMWSRVDKFDYAWPEFANLGEQPILNKELMVDSSEDAEFLNSVFGYTPRYAEYKYHPSTVHGDFRETLQYWHLGRYFANSPQLNKEFVHPDADSLNRIFAVETNNVDHFWIQIYNNVKAKRPLPYYGVPLL